MFKFYFRIGYFGGTLTYLSNMIFVKNIDPGLKSNPNKLIAAFLLKGIVNGTLWPSIPFQLYYNFDGFTILGKGIEKELLTPSNIPYQHFGYLSRKWKTPD